MISRSVIFIVAMAAGIALAGCSDFRASGGSSDAPAKAADGSAARPPAPSRTTLIPQSRPPVADLPVPIGFAIVESMSRSFESSGARYVDHTYQGRADKFDVERFARENLVHKGWRLRSSQMVRGDFELKLEKASELLDVTIRGEERPILGHSTTLRYNLQTAGRSAPAR